ncbi:tyrosine aminotransferase [Hetaerina americana]|uniref:tyrosine aminotransferase n=1 Tax=Hetaerina americana TaxID=62018 RepID=UPI003A7F19AA
MPHSHEYSPVDEHLLPPYELAVGDHLQNSGRSLVDNLNTEDCHRYGSRALKSPRSSIPSLRQSYSRSRYLRARMKNGRGGWCVRASALARNTFNPIRAIVENLRLAPHPDKPMIALSIGDPTIFGNLKPPQEAVEAVCASVQSMNYNGYAPSVGYQEAREAVAKYCSTSTAVVDAKDIILCSGCSHAIDLCISVLGNPGKNILVPRPGFSIYRTLAEGLGLKVKSYDLLPEQGWEADLEQMESQLDADTVAIIVNNPSNPCGSVFSKEHLLKILDIARRNYVPIIADEIYDHFVFPGHEFYSLGSLSEDVPILTCGGLTKRFLVPGWRMGWIVIHDRNGVFDQEIRKGLNCLSQRIIGSNTLVQGALPSILSNTPTEFFKETLSAVQGNAELAYDILDQVPGLTPIMPEGAMYMMVGIDMEKFPEFKTDLEFVEQMVTEESVFCLPGKCFDYPNYVRIVLTVPEAQMREACERIEDFCCRHFQVFGDEEMDMNTIEEEEKKIREPTSLFDEKILLTPDGNRNGEESLTNKVPIMSDEGRRP